MSSETWQDFEQNVVDMLPRLRRFATKLAGAIEGEDLLQLACMKALEKRSQWQPGSRLDSWIFKIIRTTWLDHCKSATRQRVDFDTEAANRAADKVAISTMDDELDWRRGLEQVRRAIQDLPPDQRAVLMLVVGQGLRYQDAAEVLDIPLGTVMSRLARARMALGRPARTIADGFVPVKAAARQPLGLQSIERLPSL